MGKLKEKIDTTDELDRIWVALSKMQSEINILSCLVESFLKKGKSKSSKFPKDVKKIPDKIGKK